MDPLEEVAQIKAKIMALKSSQCQATETVTKADPVNQSTIPATPPVNPVDLPTSVLIGALIKNLLVKLHIVERM